MLDYIIVGQGLAGSVLAWKLLEAGKKVFVINSSAANQASHIAAGVYNPITGKNLVKTWLADQLCPSLVAFYTQVETALSVKILYPTPLLRPFINHQEKASYYTKMQAEEDKHLYISFDEPPEKDIIFAPHGGLVIQQAGCIDVPVFLQAIRTYLQALGSYVEANFCYEEVGLAAEVSYQGINAKKLIFCEGGQAVGNPFFNYLPFKLVKGEILTVQLSHTIQSICARNVFVVPRPNGQAFMGTTYDWDHLDTLPTEIAKQEIENKVRKFFMMPYQLISQKAGIRPATFDRRPFIGLHPSYPQLAIMNGLGSKGVSLAPYLAGEFVHHLLYNKRLPPEMRLDRGKRHP